MRNTCKQSSYRTIFSPKVRWMYDKEVIKSSLLIVSVGINREVSGSLPHNVTRSKVNVLNSWSKSRKTLTLNPETAAGMRRSHCLNSFDFIIPLFSVFDGVSQDKLGENVAVLCFSFQLSFSRNRPQCSPPPTGSTRRSGATKGPLTNSSAGFMRKNSMCPNLPVRSPSSGRSDLSAILSHCSTSHRITGCASLSVGFLDVRVKGRDSKWVCVDTKFTLIQASVRNQPPAPSIKESAAEGHSVFASNMVALRYFKLIYTFSIKGAFGPNSCQDN